MKAALASADKYSRLVIVFQQPDNKEAQQQFAALFAKYKEEGGSNGYPYELYLATTKDMKTLKAKGVPTGNQMAVLDVAGNLLYNQPSTIEDVAKALGNPKLSVKDLQAIFTTFLKKDSQRV